MWYFFNAVFAIFNKRTLNVFPYPWLLSWIQVRIDALPVHPCVLFIMCGGHLAVS